MRIPLGVKISLLISLLVLVSVGILGYFLYQAQKNNLINSAIEGGKSQVYFEAAKIENSVLELTRDLRFLAQTPPIQGIIRAHANSDIDPIDGSTESLWRQRLESIFKAFLSGKKQYLQLRYIGVSDGGKEIVRAGLQDGAPIIIEASILQAKGDRSYFREAIKLPKDEIYLSPITLNSNYDKITLRNMGVLTAAVPIYDANEKVFGAVIISMNFGSILDKLIESDEHISFVNHDGDYIGHQSPELNFGFDLGKRHQIQATYPELSHLFEDGNSDSNFVYISEKPNQGEAIYVLKTQYSLSEVKRFIGLVHVEKISAIMARSKSVVNETLLLIFGLIVISICIGLYFSRRLISPLKQISLATTHFAEEEKETRFQLFIESNDEIGDLARSFQTMIENMKARSRELIFQKLALDEHAIVSIADAKGNITFVNDKFCQISGYSRDELVGKNHRIVISGEHPLEFFKNMWATISSGEAWHGDIKNKNKGGGYYWVRTTIVPNLGEDGKPFQYVGIRTEITENKNLEEELVLSKEEAEKANLAKSLFLANMSHEIRTPMNAILGFSQILLRKKYLDRDTKDSLRTIDTSGRNLLTMINEILDISKIEAGKMELNISDFDLKHLLNHVAQLFALRCQQKKLDWVVAEFSSAVLVRGDEMKLQQTLVNLLGNAVKFTDIGKVELVVTSLGNDQFKFDVIDSGKGIPIEAQDKIFDAFQQDEQGEKKGGTGLGLAISKKQLELMGSDLFLKSEANKGAHFYFTLTLPPAEKEVLEDNRGKYRNVTHLAAEHKVKVLVVDDVKENRDVLSKLLSSIGAEIIQAENGKKAVEKVKEHMPDIVFMDMRMPVMSGEDATKLILEEFGNDRIKIIAITASAFDLRREHYIEKGFHEYISKPFKTEEIFECLDELLGVEFVYDDDGIAQEETSSIEKLDLTQIFIPKDLYDKLTKSADSYNITELERNLEELGQNSEVPKQLVERLEQLLGKYDMEAILKVLGNVSKTKA